MTRQSTRPLTPASRGPRSLRLTAGTVGALVVGVGVLSPAPALAAGSTLYVDGGSLACSDTGSGTTTTAPFCTISAAVKAAGSGDTVSVVPRTYPEQVTLPTDGLTVTSSGAVVDGGSGVRTYGFVLNGRTNVRISGFTFQGQKNAGISLSGTSGSSVSDVVMTATGTNGVVDTNGSGNTITRATVTGATSVGILVTGGTGETVSSSTTHDNVLHGVRISGGGSNAVRGVTSYTNGKQAGTHARVATGIDVSGGAANTVLEGNTTYGNDDSGIEVYPNPSGGAATTGTLVRRNVTYDNGDHGIDVAGAPDTTVVFNTIVGNTNVGLNVEASGAGVASSGATLRDNISAENGVAPTTGSQGEIRVDTASTSGTTMDRDLVWRADGGQLFAFGNTFSSTLAGIQTGAGQELHGLVADPRFASLSGRDLRLTAASPAVDAAFADVPGWRDADRDGNPPVDQSSVANTGSGTPPFADIGAYELTGGTPPPPPPSAPTASLTATPNPATTDSPVTLDASGSRATATGASLTFKFDCGDKSVPPTPDQSSAGKASCTYPTAAAYTASVTVTDSNNQTATAAVKVTVNAPTAPAPTAKLTAKPATVTTGGSSTLDATGSAAATGLTITDYAFDCANGSPVTHGTLATRACTYTKAGPYLATVTVTDSNQQTASATATVTVTDPTPSAPAAHLTATPAQVVAGGTSTLNGSGSTATASGAALTGYRFDCGNGAAAVSGTATTAKCTYPKAGSYTATLTVTDSNGKTDSASATVTVTAPAPPHARLHLVMKRLPHGHLRVRLDASASTGSPGAPLVAFRFYCGNGHHTTWLQRTSVACVYRHHGRYRVKLRVKNSLGMVDTVTRVVRFRRH